MIEKIPPLNTRDLAATPGFQTLPDTILQCLLDCATRHHLSAGQTLFEPGDDYHERIYLLAAGKLQVKRQNGQLEFPSPGYLVGLSSYISQGPYAACAEAIGEVDLLTVSHADLESLEHRSEALADAFDRMIGHSLRQRRSRQIQTNGLLLNQRADRLMSTPLITCAAATTLREAVRLMDASGHGSLIITDEGGHHRQITYKSLARQLALPGVDAATVQVNHAQEELPAVECNDPIWKVQELQMHTGAKYALVMDSGKPVGMISQTNLANLLSSPQLQLANKIQSCRDYPALRYCYDSMAEFAADNLESHRYARDAVQSLSIAHLNIQRRCVELTLEEMESEGLGTAPADYALIIMGSGGRREMLLDPDQDNGLILADDLADKGPARDWFKALCERVNQNLDCCGYILCPGKIMANNPKYHKTLGEWQHQIRHIAKHPTEKAARWSNIVFDFATLHGDVNLTRSLRSSMLEIIHAKPRLLQFMVDDDAQGRASLGWFNRLLTHEDSSGREIVDVKRNGLRIVINAARILSLGNGIGVGNTHDRITALVRAGALSRDHGATVLDAYDELLEILLNHQIRQRRAGQAPDKRVAPEELLRPERESLRVAMRAVQRFQEKLQDSIGRSGL